MAHIDRFGRQVYSPAQITQFLDRIALPAKYRRSAVLVPGSGATNTAEGLAFVGVLQRYFLAHVPWGNLEMHYSQHHTISLDAQHLFDKIVARDAGLGGWCMENSAIFGTVLASLGYEVMPTGARVNEACQPMAAGRNWKGPRFDGWNHMVNILTITSKKYLIDVGFGSNSPTAPVPLLHNHTRTKVPPSNAELLLHTTLADNTSSLPMWIYHFRFAPTQPWIPAYCFSDAVEFLPADFTTMNYFVCRSPSSWFGHHVVCSKFVMEGGGEGKEDGEGEGEGELVGDITLFGNEIKKRVRGGESVALMEIESEEDRVVALSRFLGVRLTQPERDGISGLVSEIK